MKTTVAETASSIKDAVSGAADAVVGYVDPLAKDDKLRRRLVAAVAAGAAARRQARRQMGFAGFARRLGTDALLQAQLLEMARQLSAVQKRAKKARSHRIRNAALFVGGVGMTVAALPAARTKLMSLVQRRGATQGWPQASKQTTIEEEIEVDVPVSTAYNQWTQFEEFPRFMEGVDEVRQLDDTLLHWAATVAGKHAEWDARILDQEPDRRITWESTDGKRTRGTVNFEEAGPGRTRIRLNMSYTPEGPAEMVGSAVGLDTRRIRGDLERFRELIESQRVETGAWRGEIRGGVETGGQGSA